MAALLALAAAIPLGFLSWYLVEKPMLHHRPGGSGGQESGDALTARPALSP